MSLLLFLLLLTAFVVGLAMVPFGLPGLWVMVLSLVGYAAVTGFHRVGPFTLVVVLALAVLGEALEAWIGFRFARRYGGSSRAGWGAIVGGLAGALIGTPVPVIGNVIGAFIGAFAGAALFEYTLARQTRASLGAGWGAGAGGGEGTAGAGCAFATSGFMMSATRVFFSFSRFG